MITLRDGTEHEAGPWPQSIGEIYLAGGKTVPSDQVVKFRNPKLGSDPDDPNRYNSTEDITVWTRPLPQSNESETTQTDAPTLQAVAEGKPAANDEPPAQVVGAQTQKVTEPAVEEATAAATESPAQKKSLIRKITPTWLRRTPKQTVNVQTGEPPAAGMRQLKTEDGQPPASPATGGKPAGEAVATEPDAQANQPKELTGLSYEQLNSLSGDIEQRLNSLYLKPKKLLGIKRQKATDRDISKLTKALELVNKEFERRKALEL